MAERPGGRTEPPGAGGGAARRSGPARPGGLGLRPDNWAARHPVLAVALSVFVLSLAGAAALFLTLPDVENLREGWPETTAFMELRREQAREEGGELDLHWDPVPLGRIPRTVQRAVLAAEDAAFYSHGGFDWEQVRYALRKAWEEKSITRGASTITQQLAKNLYLSPARNPVRKLREALISWKLERELPKRRILELYLNVVEFGSGVFGVQAAARHYFGVDIAAVGPRQAAMLAATLPSPLRNNPATDTARFRWRTNLVQRLAFGREEERVDIVPPPDPVLVEDPVFPGRERPLIDTVRVDSIREAADTGGVDTAAAEATETEADTATGDPTEADTAGGEPMEADTAGGGAADADTVGAAGRPDGRPGARRQR